MNHTGERFFDDTSTHIDQFGPLLVLSVVAIVAMGLFDSNSIEDSVRSSIASTAVSVIIGVTLVLALRASGLAQRWRRGAQAFVAFALAVSVILLAIDLGTDADLSAFDSGRPSPFFVLIAVLSPIAVVHRLVEHRRVTGATMLGAVSAYLLIAIAFAYVFNFLAGPQGDEFFTDPEATSTTLYLYFSLETITTLGYGDLQPSTDLGRLLATSEAVIGQVYLVTFVAMFVGLLIQQSDTSTVESDR